MSKRSRESSSSSDTAVAVCPHVAYTLEHEDVVVYAGQTHQPIEERESQHFRGVGGAVRVNACVQKWGGHTLQLKVQMRLEGTTKEALGVETYLAVKHNTIFPKRSNKVCDEFGDRNIGPNGERKFPWPDISLEGQPFPTQLNCNRSTADEALIKCMGERYEKKTRGGTVLPKLTDNEMALVRQRVEMELFGALVSTETAPPPPSVFPIDSPVMKARELRRKYEDMDVLDYVPCKDACTDLDAILAMLKEDEEDVELQKMVKRWRKQVHPDRTAEEPILVDVVVGVFTTAEAWCGAHLEKKLVAVGAAEQAKRRSIKGRQAINPYEQAIEWRDWMKSNDGKTPRQFDKKNLTPAEAREKSLGDQLHNWKMGHNNDPRLLHISIYGCVLRHFPDFEARCEGQAKKSIEVAKKVNKLLLDGFGMRYVEGDGVKSFPSVCTTCGKVTDAYVWLSHYVTGSSSTGADVAFKNVPESRVVMYRTKHETKRPAMLAAMAAADAKRRAK